MTTKKVYQVYDKIIDWIDEHRTKTLMEKEYLDLIVNSIPKGGSILDLGCGTAEPIARYFIEQGFKITGVDGSQKMIELCKKRFPKQNWLVADMQYINLNKKFDAIIAWHSFFYLEHDAQRVMFSLFKSHLKPGGILAFTSGIEHGEVWSNNGGEELYHASLSSEEYEKLLAASSFQVLKHKIQDPDCGEATVWVAQRELPMPIITPRLLLRPPQLGDEEVVNAAVIESFDILHKFMPWAKTKPTLDETKEFVSQASANWVVKRNEEPYLPLFIFEKNTHEFIGATGFHDFDWEKSTIETGYWIHNLYAKKGYMTEAVNAITQYAFKELQVKYIRIKCDVTNERSKKIPERLDYALVTTLKADRKNLVTGEDSDTLVYVKQDIKGLPPLKINW